jgi:hypothetical protein
MRLYAHCRFAALPMHYWVLTTCVEVFPEIGGPICSLAPLISCNSFRCTIYRSESCPSVIQAAEVIQAATFMRLRDLPYLLKILATFAAAYLDPTTAWLHSRTPRIFAQDAARTRA